MPARAGSFQVLLFFVDLQADERAAADVVELLERLHLCEGLTEQRTRAREWVVELRDRLHQEGRGQAVLGALDKTVKSLSRG